MWWKLKLILLRLNWYIQREIEKVDNYDQTITKYSLSKYKQILRIGADRRRNKSYATKRRRFRIFTLVRFTY